MNSRNVSSYFYRSKITRPVQFFTLFLKGNVVIESMILSGRLNFNLSKSLT